jgi:hypothetical protein
LVERDMAKSLSDKVKNNVALNASSSDKVESSPNALKTKKEDSSDEGSTDEEMALVLRNFKKFIKKKYYKKGGDDKKRPSQRRFYECKEVGHYIADFPQLKNKERRRRGTWRRARTTRKNIEVMFMLVKSGSLVLKTPIKKVWQL